MSIISHDPFLARTHRETVELLEQARNLFVHNLMEKSFSQAAPSDKLRVTTRWLLVTSRLGAIMEWLLEQEAIREGRVSRKSLPASRALFRNPVWREAPPPEDLDVPSDLRSLLDRSWSLFQRVARLDDQFRLGASLEFTENLLRH